MMRDPVAEFADGIEVWRNLGTLNRPAREDFDQVIPPEHVVFRSRQSRPEAKGKFRNDPACIEGLASLGQNVCRRPQHRPLLWLKFHCVPPSRLTVASCELSMDGFAQRDFKPL